MSDPVPKSSLVPPGGWHFVDRSTALPHRVEGTSFEDVALRVLQFRVTNNLEPGNPSKEVSDYICGTWPHFCTSSPAPHPAKGSMPFSNRVSGWLGRFFTSSKNDPGVPQEEAERRAAICAACPQNRDYTKGGCGPCIDGIRRLSFVWLRNRKTKHDAALGACNVFGHPNAVAVQAADLNPTKQLETGSDHQPEDCWRR